MSWGEAEQRKLEKILFRKGFQFMFAEYNDSNYREEIIDEISDKYPPGTRLDVSEFSGFGEINIRLPEVSRENRTVHLLGLEKWFRSGRASPYGFNLNREYYRDNCPAALFLWLDTATIREFALKAPDFWAFRTAILDCMRPFDPVRDIIVEKFEWDEVYRPERIEELEEYLRNNRNGGILEASLRQDLGTLLSVATRNKEARKEYERAIELFREVYRKLAKLERKVSGPKKAAPVLEEGLRAVEGWLDANQADNLETAAVCHAAAAMAFDSDDFDRALSYADRSLGIREKTLPPDHYEIGMSHQVLSSVHFKAGRLEDALEHAEKSAEIHEKALGPDDIHTAMTLANLAQVRVHKRQLPEALEAAERSRLVLEEISTERWGLAYIYGVLNSVYFAMGQLDHALEFAEKSDELLKLYRPSEHPDIAVNYLNLANIHNLKGDSRALEFAEKAREIMEKNLSPKSPYLADVFGTLSGIYLTQKGFAKASEYCRKAIAILEDHPHPVDSKLSTNYHNLAAILYEYKDNPQRDLSEIQEYAEKSVSILKKHSLAHDDALFASNNILAKIALDKKDAKLLLQYAEENRSLLKKSKNPNPIHVALIHNLLGCAYHELGRKEEAVQELQEAVALARKTYPAGHPELQKMRKNLEHVQAGKKGLGDPT